MPISIKERLDGLTVAEMSLLQYAFEQQIGQFVPINDDKFVGVNVEHVQHLEILESTGSWAYGVIKGGQ